MFLHCFARFDDFKCWAWPAAFVFALGGCPPKRTQAICQVVDMKILREQTISTLTVETLNLFVVSDMPVTLYLTGIRRNR